MSKEFKLICVIVVILVCILALLVIADHRLDVLEQNTNRIPVVDRLTLPCKRGSIVVYSDIETRVYVCADHWVQFGGEMTDDSVFDLILETAHSIEMSEEDKEKQRRSFAWGNANIDNPLVTREMIDQAADELAKEKK